MTIVLVSRSHPFREESDGLVRNQIGDRLRTVAGVHPVHQDKRQTAMRSFDHLERIARFPHGVLGDFGSCNLEFHRPTYDERRKIRLATPSRASIQDEFLCKCKRVVACFDFAFRLRFADRFEYLAHPRPRGYL